MELEKIRQAETEVRWQHEEDVEECNNCRQQFSVTRRRHHCRHCGRIFCTDCVTKQVTIFLLYNFNLGNYISNSVTLSSGSP